MIIDELKQDLQLAIAKYAKRYNASSQIPSKRQLDIFVINQIMKEPDPLIICEQLNRYLDNICLPLYRYFTFIDLNYFISSLKEVLGRNKYHPLNLMRTIIGEKDAIIANLKKAIPVGDLYQERNIAELLTELTLLKNENIFLYQTLSNLEKQIEIQENINKKYLENMKGSAEEVNRQALKIKI